MKGPFYSTETDLRQIDPVDLRRHVGAVLQDVTLFQGSLRDNMTLGAGDVDDDHVLRVAKLAGVDAFAARHPLGYDMMVGERGSQLSGGPTSKPLPSLVR